MEKTINHTVNIILNYVWEEDLLYNYIDSLSSKFDSFKNKEYKKFAFGLEIQFFYTKIISYIKKKYSIEYKLTNSQKSELFEKLKEEFYED